MPNVLHHTWSQDSIGIALSDPELLTAILSQVVSNFTKAADNVTVLMALQGDSVCAATQFTSYIH